MGAIKLFFLGLLALGAGVQAEETLSIGIYYETLCPDSISFIERQLYPLWYEFYDLLEIKFAPYGFAKSIPNGNTWNFTCQHGPDECYGNMVQACMVNVFTDQNDQINLITCMMGNPYPPSGYDICLNGMDPEKVERVYECINSDLGAEYLYQFGVETDSLMPVPHFVPHVLFNQAYDDDEINLYMDDLRKLVCDKYLPNAEQCK